MDEGWRQALDDASERIESIDAHGESRVAARLRAGHERVRQALAGGEEVEAELRTLCHDVREVEQRMLGLDEAELHTLDQWLDEVARALAEWRAHEPARRVAELDARIAAARDRRALVDGAPPAARRAHLESYAALVARVRELSASPASCPAPLPTAATTASA